MSVHVHLRGSLKFPDASAASAALDHVKKDAPESTLLDGMTIKGAKLHVKFDNFTSSADDVDHVLALLQEAAQGAVDGKVLFDEEGGRELQIAPTHALGGPPQPGDQPRSLSAKGSFTFATEDDAKAAFDALAEALVAYPPKKLRLEGTTVKIAIDGEAPQRVAGRVPVVVRDLVCVAVSGKVTVKRYPLKSTHVAPLATVGPDGGDMKHLQVEGKVSCKDPAAAEALAADLRALHLAVRRRGKTQLEIETEGRCTEATCTAIFEGLQSLRPKAKHMNVLVMSPWMNGGKYVR